MNELHNVDAYYFDIAKKKTSTTTIKSEVEIHNLF